MRSIVRVLATAVLASGAMIAAGSTGASAACKGHSHSATGSSGALQYLASVSAKYAWKSSVAAHDGPAFDTWGKAKNKSVSCKKSGPNKSWVCVAKGKPCD